MVTTTAVENGPVIPKKILKPPVIDEKKILIGGKSVVGNTVEFSKNVLSNLGENIERGITKRVFVIKQKADKNKTSQKKNIPELKVQNKNIPESKILPFEQKVEKVPHFFPSKEFAILGNISTFFPKRNRWFDGLVRAFEMLLEKNKYLAGFFIVVRLMLYILGFLNLITYTFEKIYTFSKFSQLFFKKIFFNMSGEAKKLSTLTIKTKTDHCELLNETRLIYSFEVENDDGITKNSLNYLVLDLFATQIQELMSQHFEEIKNQYTGNWDAISFGLGALKGCSEERLVFLESYAPGAYLVFNTDLSGD